MTDKTLTLEECESVVAEVLLAHRLFAEEGCAWSGRALHRWRALPNIERRYFSALLAPYRDPDAVSRTQVAVSTDDGCRYECTPPYPEPCSCGCAVYASQWDDYARCSRCLRAWGLRRSLAQGKEFELLRGDIYESVDRKNIGFAADHLGWRPESGDATP